LRGWHRGGDPRKPAPVSALRFAQLPFDLLQVSHQTLILLVALFLVGEGLRTDESSL
jgi:hypothetical protein